MKPNVGRLKMPLRPRTTKRRTFKYSPKCKVRYEVTVSKRQLFMLCEQRNTDECPFREDEDNGTEPSED
jgi:hypothetical protein